jgi:NAD(P) transhydrogenase subunit alpha
MIIGVPKESMPGERRVALVPASLPVLTKLGHQVIVERGAGDAAGFTDQPYQDKGATIATSRRQVFESAEILCMVRTLGANPRHGEVDLDALREQTVILGLGDPLTALAPSESMARRGVSLLALELLPRITRAQSMDVLSSQATIAGYKAVLLAAEHLAKMFPMIMTAAGTIPAAKVLVIGAGVAGLQAIATARKLGAIVTGYDVRPAVKEQVKSLGAKFLELPLETAAAEGQGGYANAMDDSFYRRQQEMMGAAVAEHDVVITTAAVPGKKSPVLVTADMVQKMRRGSVIVDLAAERGGNCELTRADEVVVVHGVTILGPTNLPASVPHDASLMFSRNVTDLLKHLTKDGKIVIDTADEITRETLVCHRGEIVHEKLRSTFGKAAALAATT